MTHVQQRPVLSRSDLQMELTRLMMSFVSSSDGEPDSSMLRKADTTVQQIMTLLDKYPR